MGKFIHVSLNEVGDFYYPTSSVSCLSDLLEMCLPEELFYRICIWGDLNFTSLSDTEIQECLRLVEEGLPVVGLAWQQSDTCLYTGIQLWKNDVMPRIRVVLGIKGESPND